MIIHLIRHAATEAQQTACHKIDADTARLSANEYCADLVNGDVSRKHDFMYARGKPGVGIVLQVG